jgi:Mrp family chromosome partitioning ATPase
MSKHSIVLEKAAPHVDLFGQGTVPPVAAAERPVINDAYGKLGASLFGLTGRPAVVAFASVQSGAGVSYVVRGLASSLARSGKSVAVFDGDLRRIPAAGSAFPDALPNSPFSILGTAYHSDALSGSEFVDGLRAQFDCALLDCGSLETASGIMRLASVCDGVVVVAEAGRATPKSLRRAAQVVELAQGKLLGVVLNKRKYPIPSWLYRIL